MNAFRSELHRRWGLAASMTTGRKGEIKIAVSHREVLAFLVSAKDCLTANQIYHGMVPGNARITHGVVNAALARLVSIGVVEKVRTSSAIYVYKAHSQ